VLSTLRHLTPEQSPRKERKNEHEDVNGEDDAQNAQTSAIPYTSGKLERKQKTSGAQNFVFGESIGTEAICARG
jgi:hypothetical protein